MKIRAIRGAAVCAVLLLALAVILVYRWLEIPSTISKAPFKILRAEETSHSLVVSTDKGKVQGAKNDNGTAVFSSIPFAEPPVGNLRYAPPKPRRAWQGVLDARLPITRCMQEVQLFWPSWPGDRSEDCLWLSVTTPGLDGSLRPVVVWVHGGGLVFGGAGERIYDGAILSKRGDLVLVNLQYRLGTFGWLDVAEVGGYQGSATNGEADIIEGLRWVRSNIARFGGDPDNVTIMGESGGSMAVASLLRRPVANELFHKAILQSAVTLPGDMHKKKPKVTRQFMEYLGAKSLEELQSRSPTELLAAQARLLDAAEEIGTLASVGLFAPAPVTVEDLEFAARSGKPILHGVTTHEMHAFSWGLGDDPQAYKELAYRNFNEIGLSAEAVDALASHVESTQPGRQQKDIYLDVMSGLIFMFPHHVLAREWSRYATIYQYQFDWQSPSFPGAAVHGSDLPFTFGNLDSLEILTGDEPPREISLFLQDAISRFARTGDPSTPTQAWPAYTTDAEETVIVNVAPIAKNNPVPWLKGYVAIIEERLAAQR